jgi:hypothetical protein
MVLHYYSAPGVRKLRYVLTVNTSHPEGSFLCSCGNVKAIMIAKVGIGTFNKDKKKMRKSRQSATV